MWHDGVPCVVMWSVAHGLFILAFRCSHDRIPCILNRCEDCKDARRLFEGQGALCEDEMRDPAGSGLATKVKFERYEKVQYTCKDGTVKEKKDFQSVEVPFSEFKADFLKYWPKFIAHHNDAHWHDDDFQSLRDKLPLGQAGLVIDFAENYSHEPRIEHQSKYFSQTQTTIVPVVLMFRIEDLTNVTERRRTQLLEYFDRHSLPRVISETHFVISADMQHDNAFVRKILDDLITPYIKQAAPSIHTLHGRSDGCKAQFKCASHFDWVSRQSKEGCGLVANWSFFTSCHGKVRGSATTKMPTWITRGISIFHLLTSYHNVFPISKDPYLCYLHSAIVILREEH